MQKLYLTMTQSQFSALDGSLNEEVERPIEVGDVVRVVVPRWLAVACKLELDHEHDERWAAVDA